MAMPNTKIRKERIDAASKSIDDTLAEIKTTYTTSGFGFDTVAEFGFNKTNAITDLSKNVRGMAIPEEETIPFLGIVDGYATVNTYPFKGYAKNGVTYADPNSPSEAYTESRSNTLMTDRADGNLNINRWTSRNIFKFTSRQYKYDRCLYIIPVAELANGVVIDGGDDTPHGNTLKNYPYPEEIIMTSQKTEKNFIHFINVQYSDSHYGHFNGRNYNLMIVNDRTRYGEDDSGNNFKKYTSVYANDIDTELAFIKDGYLYLPIPDEVYGEELLDTLWDCRVIWREDAPDRDFTIETSLDTNNNPTAAVWTEGTISDTNRSWYSVCYGKDKFVAVAFNSNVFAYSYNGIDWTEVTVGDTSRHWYSVCYGKDKFVAVASVTTIFAYSTDGITWTEGTISDTNRTWESVCYGNDKFVAIAYNLNVFAYSYDGIDWIEVTISDTRRYWESVCYGNDKFVAIAYNLNVFAYSYDGIDWIEVTISDTDRTWTSVCYGKDKFVAVASGSTVFAYSTDGITWTEVTVGNTDRYWQFVCYGNDKFVAIASESTVFAYSANGITWTEGTISDTNRKWSSVYYGKDKFVAVSRISNISTCWDIPYNINDAISFNICDGRIIYHTDNNNAHIVTNRNYITDFNYSIINHPISSKYGSPLIGHSIHVPMGFIAPTYSSSYELCADDEIGWQSPPNQIFNINYLYYLGFYYNDGVRGLSQLYWGLFDGKLKTVDRFTSDTDVDIVANHPHYPCKYSSSEFDNEGEILRIFQDSISFNNSSSFYVVTQSAIYRFNFTISDAVYTSIEKLINVPRLSNGNINTSLKYSHRISDTEFLLYSIDGTIYKIDITGDINEFYIGNGNTYAPMLLGKYMYSTIYNTRSSYYYDSSFGEIKTNSDGVSEDYSSIYTIYQNYCLLSTSDNKQKKICKLKETFTFDKELLAPPESE